MLSDDDMHNVLMLCEMSQQSE